MNQIAGTYELVSSENYAEHLASLGLDKAQVERAVGSKSPLVINSVDDKQITILFRGKEKTFVFNEVTNHTLPTGQEVSTVAENVGNKIVFKSKTLDGNYSEERVFDVAGPVLTATTTSSTGIVTKRVYKRE